MIGYVECFESYKTMSFKISDNKLLKKYNQIWKKVKNLLKIKFNTNLFLVTMINSKYEKEKYMMVI